MFKDDEIHDLYVNAPEEGRQKGCKWFYSCDSCHLQDCISKKKSVITKLKHDAIWEYSGKGFTVATLTGLFNVSRRTVYRVLEK